MKIALNLPAARKWLDMLVSGEKRDGYRATNGQQEVKDPAAENASAPEQPGNAAAMRKALERLRDWAALDLLEHAIGTDEVNYRKLVDGILEISNAALAAPPRNCDIGTAEEQKERFEKFCEAQPTANCHSCHLAMNYACEFEWAQMPYEAPAEPEE